MKKIIYVLLMIFVCQVLHADEGSCFIKDGDRVGFFGDSITAHKIYGELVEKVFRNCYPDADVKFINNGQSGLQLAGTKLEKVIKGDPNVVTIMIGMNDAINSSWVKGDPIEPKVEQYRSQLTELVQGLKSRDKIVVIMSPTLTDETVAGSCFRLEGTEVLLQRMGQVCEEVAKSESVYFIPVQSEFEEYGLTLPRYALLRPDGVHPCARGHYQIARSIWTHMNIGAQLEGKREIVAAPKELDIALTPIGSVLPDNSLSATFNMDTDLSGELDLNWSSGEWGDIDTMNLGQSNVFELFLPRNFNTAAAGTSATVILECEKKGLRKFFIIDLFVKAVIHGKDGIAEGNIKDDDKALATYNFAKDGKNIRFEITVFKDKLVHKDSMWPWGRGDGVNLLLDLREESEFAGLGYDGDVFQLWLTPQEMPYFSPGFIPWAGRHLVNLAIPYGEKTVEDYKVGVLLGGNINIREKKDYSNRNLIGFDLSLGYETDNDKKKNLGIGKYDRQTFLYPGAFSVIDFYNKIENKTVVTTSVFP